MNSLTRMYQIYKHNPDGSFKKMITGYPGVSLPLAVEELKRLQAESDGSTFYAIAEDTLVVYLASNPGSHLDKFV